MPNLIAGIIIGITNELFLNKIIAAFIWAIVFAVSAKFIRKEQLKKFIEVAITNEKGKTRMHLSPRDTFYLIEFITGFISALFFALITMLTINLV